MLLVALAIMLHVKSSERKNLQIMTGDYVGELVLVNSDDNESLLKEMPLKNVIVFYISDRCHPCIDKLPSINLFCKTIDSDDFSSIIVWRETIPEKLVNKSKMDYNYSLKHVELSNFTPDFYLIEDNKVLFETQDFEKLLKKVLMNFEKKDLQEKILASYVNEYNFKNESINVLFLGDSKFENIDNDSYDLVISSNNLQEYDIYDPENVLSTIFDIDSFPVCLTYNTETLEYEKKLQINE